MVSGDGVFSLVHVRGIVAANAQFDTPLEIEQTFLQSLTSEAKRPKKKPIRRKGPDNGPDRMKWLFPCTRIPAIEV
jgi:hypothetical protein